MFHTENTPEAEYTDVLHLDLGTVQPSIAGPKRPQDRVYLGDVKKSFETSLPTLVKTTGASPTGGGTAVATEVKTTTASKVKHGSVVIAAITSCTNTSNPSVMLAAGLLAKKAVEKGLTVPSWVKSSLAPGSKVVTEYLAKAGLTPYLDKLKFNLVGYGCTTCIGNSGPLPQEVSDAVAENDLVVVSVLSGNRNFEGRINSEVRANYLMSPPLVVAYAIAGRIDFDIYNEPLATGKDGKPVFLKDVWPTQKEVNDVVSSCVTADMFRSSYGDVFKGDANWQGLPVPTGDTYAWDRKSTYVQNPPYFEGMGPTPKSIEEIKGARVLAKLGNSVTTDHISPAGSIKPSSPAGKYLQEHGVTVAEFNSYGSRRGNHEVMMRGTFANVRLRNRLVEVEGGFTKHMPSNEQMSIYDAAMKYKAEHVPTIILAGKEYGSGSSRDWAAKGPMLLGVRAVIAESFERIHRSNLVGMGIAPLQFQTGQDADALGLTGEEVYEIVGLRDVLANYAPGKKVKVRATGGGGSKEFEAVLRIDTPQEVQYYQNGGILQYVLRQLLNAKKASA
jgi:aconitate hydratase